MPASGEVNLGMLGLDTAFGRDGVAAFKTAATAGSSVSPLSLVRSQSDFSFVTSVTLTN